MAQRNAILALYVAVCLVHAIYATVAGFQIVAWSSVAPLSTVFVGALASLASILLGLVVMLEAHGSARRWLKVSLTLQILAPFAWWTIYAPIPGMLYLGDDSPEGFARINGVAADLAQAQIAIAAVAWAGLFCAAKTIIATLEELAA